MRIIQRLLQQLWRRRESAIQGDDWLRSISRICIAVQRPFFSSFYAAFDAADVVIIADIFPAREQDTGLVHARNIVDALAERAHFSGEGAEVLYGADLQTHAEIVK